jgi:hypothetical protein
VPPLDSSDCHTVALPIRIVLRAGRGHADWWWPFGPKDYEEYAENAAREAKSKDALSILLYSCDSKFRGRRKPTGGYMFYDSRQSRYFDIAGPNPTPNELGYIERQYSNYVAAQAERERLWQEKLQKEQIEAERQAAIRKIEAERQAAIRQQAAERQAALAQIAQAELQKRQQTALRKIMVTTTSIECSLSLSCGLYKLTVGIRNLSGEVISTLLLGWAFVPEEEKLNCPTSLPTKHQAQVKLAPNDTTVINIDGHDGPVSKQFRYCVRVTGAEIASQR